jgi:ribulose-5-phosphate 4-epimerase/fuculose-1-phosphate aldolase
VPVTATTTGPRAENRHGRERRRRIVRKLVHRRTEREGDRDQQQCVAVGRGLGRHLCADETACAAHVLDDHRVAEALRELRRDDSADDIVAAARRERDDEPHRLAGIGLRSRANGPCQADGKGQQESSDRWHGELYFRAMALQTLEKGKSVRQQVTREEWDRRVDLAAAYRLVDLYGMTEMSANHISTRVPGEEGAFLINPYGLLYDQMKASCFIKVDLAGDVLFNPTDLNVNKAGYVIHSAIHEARPEVDCVIHTHTVAGMAVSAMKCGLMPLAQTGMRFARIAYHDYQGPAINAEEKKSLVGDLGDHAGMILRNHGLLVVGASIAEAFYNIFKLERACQVQVAALSCNVELTIPPRDVIDETYRLYLPQTRRPFGVLEWPALLARLDKIDPSFRE